MEATKTATVRFRCGAEATIRYAAADDLEQLRRELSQRDCPACSYEPVAGLHLMPRPGGGVNVWGYRETTKRRAN